MTSKEDQIIGNLLAVIHGDGGRHYQKHGLEESCQIAQDLIVATRTELDQAQHQLFQIMKVFDE